MRIQASTVNWGLVFGAALHWSTMLYMHNMESPLGSLANPPAIICAIALVTTALSRWAATSRGRIVLGISSLAAGAALVAPWATGAEQRWNPVLFSTAFSAAVALNAAPPILLWGHAFASLDKRVAGHHAILAALVACGLGLVYLGLNTLWALPSDVDDVIPRAASVALALSGLVGFSPSRPTRPKHRRRFAAFCLGRLAIGAALGVLYTTARQAVPSAVLGIATIALIATLLAACARPKAHVFDYLPVCPIVLLGIVCLPFVGNACDLPITLGCTVLWLYWIFVSSTQLSGLKDVFDVDAAQLSFWEKALIMFGWSAGMGAFETVSVGINLTYSNLATVILYAGTLWATWACLQSAYGHRENEIIQRRENERRERNRRLCEEVSRNFGLTPREQEVMELVAQGHTRASICQQLNISDGTARAHTSHIYQKLSIHKRDELLQLLHEMGSKGR